MTGPGRNGGPVRPVTALAFATVGFVALTIFGLGMTSLATGEAVIATPGLGQFPGAAGVVATMLAFAGGLWAAIGGAGRVPRGGGTDAPGRAPEPGRPVPGHPSFWGAAWTTAACFVAYVGGVWLGAVATGADVAAASAVAGRLATSWFGFVVAAAAFVCSWSGIALVRTHARRPRWPWEDDADA